MTVKHIGEQLKSNKKIQVVGNVNGLAIITGSHLIDVGELMNRESAQHDRIAALESKLAALVEAGSLAILETKIVMEIESDLELGTIRKLKSSIDKLTASIQSAKSTGEMR